MREIWQVSIHHQDRSLTTPGHGFQSPHLALDWVRGEVTLQREPIVSVVLTVTRFPEEV